MAFIGPGSEWFWAALQFTALAITFIAIYRQLRIGKSQRAVEQIEGYSRQYGDERMARYRLAILVALRDGTEIPPGLGAPIANYFENVATLSRRGHVDINLLWYSLGPDAQIWWVILAPLVERVRAVEDAALWEEWEWLVGEFAGMDRRAGGRPIVDAEWVANWRATGGVIERHQDIIRVEQELRTVIIASPEGPDTAQSAATEPAPNRTASKGRRSADRGTIQLGTEGKDAQHRPRASVSWPESRELLRCHRCLNRGRRQRPTGAQGAACRRSPEAALAATRHSQRIALTTPGQWVSFGLSDYFWKTRSPLVD